MKNINTNFYTTYSTWIGHLTFAILALMAFIFFKERTLILDASFQSFLIILHNDFAIQVHRFGAAMTQIFPLVASRLGCSLATILTIYSLAFVLVHWIMFWICDSILKQKEIAFAIVLFNVFMVNNTFFWIQNELIQGISLGFVFWSLLLRRGSFAAFHWFDYPILLGILVTLVYFHPLVVFPFLFIAVYFFLEIFDKKSESKNKTAPLSMSVILTAVIGYFIINFLNTKFTPNFYDPGAKGRIDLSGFKSYYDFILNFYRAPAYKDFMDNLWTDFALLPITLMALTVYFLIKKKFLKLCLVWTSVFVYILMIVLAYRDGGSWFHVESQYLPMSIFLILPFVWEFIPAISNVPVKFLSTQNSLKVVIVTVVLLLLFRINDIFQTHFFYKKRIDYIGQMLEKTKKFEGTKFMIEEKNIDKKIMMQSWSFAIESLYYSALQSPDSVRSIVVFPNKEELEATPKDPTVFLNRLTPSLFQNLNPRLFHQTDLVRPYILLEEKDVK
jgi:hypothetical protein